MNLSSLLAMFILCMSPVSIFSFSSVLLLRCIVLWITSDRKLSSARCIVIAAPVVAASGTSGDVWWGSYDMSSYDSEFRIIYDCGVLLSSCS